VSGPEILTEVYAVIKDRIATPSCNSYVSRILSDPKGIDKVLEKVGEESTEFILAVKNQDPERITEEAADLFFHTMIALEASGVELQSVFDEFSKRRK
jgi:phosphoribosyl-ATP pyrophosphohydrolase